MTTSASSANELRLVAASVIHELWERKERSQLELLKQQVDVSLSNLSERADQAAEARA